MRDIVKRAREALDGVTPGMARDLRGEVERLEALKDARREQEAAWDNIAERDEEILGRDSIADLRNHIGLLSMEVGILRSQRDEARAELKRAREALERVTPGMVRAERDALGEAAFAAIAAAGTDTDGATDWRSFFRPIMAPSWAYVVRREVEDLASEAERLEELVESQDDQWRELYDRHRQACIDRDAAMRRAESAEDRLEDAELAAYWMEKYDDAMEAWREAEASADRKREIIRRVRAVVNPAGGTPGVIRQVRADDIRRALDGDA